jgi:hypothetical protein
MPMSPLARRRSRRRRRTLAGAAAAATVAIVGAEVARVRRRREAHPPRRPRELLQGGGPAARETVAIVRAGYREGSANETALLNLFLAFGATFGAARAVTYSIRHGFGPWGNVEIGRRHIHHYVPGMALALLSGGASIALHHEGLDHWLAVPFGAGAALIVDETALLIELEDVYWSERGALGIDASLGAMTLLGCLTLFARLVRRGEAAVHAPAADVAQPAPRAS